MCRCKVLGLVLSLSLSAEPGCFLISCLWAKANQLLAVADSPRMNESCIDLPYVTFFKRPMSISHQMFRAFYFFWGGEAICRCLFSDGEQKWSLDLLAASETVKAGKGFFFASGVY